MNEGAYAIPPMPCHRAWQVLGTRTEEECIQLGALGWRGTLHQYMDCLVGTAHQMKFNSQLTPQPYRPILTIISGWI